MTYGPISVPTPFNDINELAESFATRVDEERVMLPFEEAIPEGEWVQFAVTLADGAPALAGSGRCTGSYDNGEDRAPEHRFDVVLDMLQLDDMSQIYFERILMARGGGEAEPPTGEVALGVEADVSLSDVQDVSELSAPSLDAYDPTPNSYGEIADDVQVAGDDALAVAAYDDDLEPSFGASQTGELDALPHAEAAPAPWQSPSAPPPAPEPRRSIAVPMLGKEAIYALPPPSAPGQLPTPHGNGVGLTRGSLAIGWSPEPAPRPDPSPRTGLFQYGSSALPQPAQPPRPNLDPSLRVRPAPRPGDPHEAMPMRARAAAPVAHYAADVDEPGYDDGGAAYSESTGEIDLDEQGGDMLDVDMHDENR